MIARSPAGSIRFSVELFLYLQVLDFLTTLVGVKIGLQEMSPFVRQLMRADPALGLAVSKLLAFALAGFCLWANRAHIIRWINYWYAGLVVWNLCLILTIGHPQ